MASGRMTNTGAPNKTTIKMDRTSITPRNNWQQEVEKLGFSFHTPQMPYWDESAYYEFSVTEILAIEKATLELWDMCLEAVDHIIENKLFHKFFIPEWVVPLVIRSWEEDQPSIYGRFDFCYKNGQLKMLEFNADTPTSIFEAGVVQWFWLKDFDKDKDQFNSIHEKLIEYWKELKTALHPGPLYFSCLSENTEDLVTTQYLMDCAMQAGLDTGLIFVEDIGWHTKNNHFVDTENNAMRNIFKLYPWEWLIHDDFGSNIPLDTQSAKWIEPAWKMLLSNKAILPILWELFPENQYLLPAYFEEGKLTDYVKKPILSREGANVEIVSGNKVLESTGGEYGEEGFIYQQTFTLPEYNGNHALVGSWVIGQQAAGMGIRESAGLITNNTSRFVPHLIK
jgi:glutathionylspermidine synthase